MNIVIKSVALLSVGVLLAQCAKEDPTVVQFKDGYSATKPKAGAKDKAPETNLLDQYGSFATKDVNSTSIFAIENDAFVVVQNPEVKVEAQTSILAKENVVFNIAYDAKKGETSGKKLIPVESLEIPKAVTIAKDTQVASFNVKVKDDAIKALKPGTYSFYLKMTAADTTVVKFKSEERQQVLVNVTIERNDDPVIGKPLREGIVYSSSQASDHIGKINDVDKDGKPVVDADSGWWADTQGGDSDLRVRFTNPTPIKGIRITTTNRAKMLASMTIQQEDESGFDEDVEGVKFIVKKERGMTFVQFAQPITPKSLLFSFYRGVNSAERYIDFNDIEFIR